VYEIPSYGELCCRPKKKEEEARKRKDGNLSGFLAGLEAGLDNLLV
jgi:hypothetical protein